MSKTEKPDVELSYKKENGNYEWRMKAGKGKPEKGPGNYEKLIVGPGDDGIFTFEIKTPKITFDPAKPIEFKLHSGGTDLSAQFMWKIVDETKLVVADPNSDSVLTEYYYQLNFNGTEPGDPSKPVKPLDPVIQNGCCKNRASGGGVQLLSATGLISVLVTAALLASLYIAYIR